MGLGSMMLSMHEIFVYSSVWSKIFDECLLCGGVLEGKVRDKVGNVD